MRKLRRMLRGWLVLSCLVIWPLASIRAENSVIQKLRVATPSASIEGRELSSRLRRFSSVNERSFVVFTSEKLQLQAVDDILVSSDRQARLEAESRLYLSYVSSSNQMQFDYLNDDERQFIAERFFLFEVARTVSEVIRNSPLERDLAKLKRTFKKLGSYVSFKVSRDESGAVGFSSVDKPGVELMKFRLSTTARTGLEPRLYFGENIFLRHSPVDGDTLFVFHRSF